MTNKRQMFYPVEDILKELKIFFNKGMPFDVITIVGEGEPTLYSGLGELIGGIRDITDEPIAVITNGALLYDLQVREDLSNADIILPTLDAYDGISFKNINRPHGDLEYVQMIRGLEEFSEQFEGQLWIEIMLLKGINDDDEALDKYSKVLKNIKYDRLYLNTPVRPPAEAEITAVDNERMKNAAKALDGISIDLLVSEGFYSEIRDDYEAVLSIIQRHPMNQFEIEGFLETRDNVNIIGVLERLKNDRKVIAINYKGYNTYRLK